MMAMGQANREKVHKIACQTFCRRNLDTLKAGMVSQGYCLLIPFGGFSYGIPVWSFQHAQRVTLHKVFSFLLVTS